MPGKDVASMTMATRACQVVRVRAGVLSQAQDLVAGEAPVALVYNGISHAVMMATPADLEEFALGFSLSEGIIARAADCYGIDIEEGQDGISVHLEIGAAAFMGLKERRRTLAGRTGCGLCGVDSLRQVHRSLPTVAPARGLHADGVRRALAAIGAEQPLNRLTGALHAAAWCGMDGGLRLVREDIGRHNALDKVIGAMARSQARPAEGFLLVTSRVSFEMAQKAIMAGVPALVGMSAPTSAAIALAEQAGMTLLAFARGRDFACYAHPGVMDMQDASASCP
jgi:FdhD protein